MSDVNQTADEFYVEQIMYWLKMADHADQQLAYWEAKRRELRKRNHESN